jgi:tetratricopeptide (TPR) repeat protein
MRAFATLLLLALVSSVPASAQGTQATADAGYYFMLGRHLETEGKIDEAIAAHKKAIEILPASAELHAELAGLYARNDRGREAVQQAELALQRDPENREANRILGSIYAAIADQKRPLRPGDDPSTYRAKAVAALEKARKGGRVDVNVEFMLGRLYMQAEEYDNAIPPLRRVVDDQPGFPEAAMLLVAAYEERNRINDAIIVLQQTLAANPGFARGHAKLAELFEGQRQFKEAAEAYAAAQAGKSKIDFTAQQASALINAGEAAEARQLVERALAQKPSGDATLLFLLAQAQRRLKDFAGAQATAARLKTAFPNDRRHEYLEAQLAEDTGRADAAIAAYKTLLQGNPDEPAFLYPYVNLLEKSGRRGEAEKVMREVIAKDPLDADALNSLGYMFAERGERLDEAVDLLHRALKIEPANPSFLDSLGWAYFRQGKLDQADAPLTEAALKLPDNSVIQDHLGDLRFRQGRFADAVAAWERALAGDGDAIDRDVIDRKLRDARARMKK